MHTATDDPASGQLITVGGGKGGVGKSLVACNLAVAFAQLGRQVVLVDLDLGAANQHLLLGVARPRAGVQRLLEGTTVDLREALTATEIPNLSLLAGTGAVLGAADIDVEEKRRLLRGLRSLGALVILDVGAGVGYNALDFFLLGGHKLVVTTPQVTAIHDAYAFLKGAVLRTLQQCSRRAIDIALLEPALLSGESARVLDILARLRAQKPELAERVFLVLRHFSAYLIGNQLPSASSLGVFHSVSKMMRDYLGIEVPLLGHLALSSRIHDSVNERRPFILAGGEAGRAFHKMAEMLLACSELPEDDDLALELEEGSAPTPAVAAILAKKVTGERPAFPGLARPA